MIFKYTEKTETLPIIKNFHMAAKLFTDQFFFLIRQVKLILPVVFKAIHEGLNVVA